VRLLVQRVTRASVSVEGQRIASIGGGILVLLGIEKGDGAAVAAKAAEKTAALRIFPDASTGKMSISLRDCGGEALVVSQFTLVASVRRGRRPSFDGAAPPDEAAALCEEFARALGREGIRVATGEFGAMMQVELVNDGPVTIWMQSGTDGEIGP
jgi:D-tyrosyl-tRNA(Tyr) deacylase